MTKTLGEYQDFKMTKMGALIGRYGDTFDKEAANRRICVFNFPERTSISDLGRFFGSDSVEGITLHEKMAFVQFKRPDGLTEALLKNMSDFNGNKIGIRPYKSSRSSSRKRSPMPAPIRRSSPTVIKTRQSYHNRDRSRSRESRRDGQHRSLERSRERGKEDSRERCRERGKEDSRERCRERGKEDSRKRGRERSRERSRDSRRAWSKERDSTSNGRRESYPHRRIPKIDQGSSSLPLSTLPDENPWGTSVFPPVSRPYEHLPPTDGAILQRIFSGQAELQPLIQPLPVTQPMQQATLAPPQLQISSMPHVSTIAAPSSSTPFALTGRILLLMRLMVEAESAAAISLGQVRELKEYIVNIEREMESAQQEPIAIVEQAQSQSESSAESVSNDPAPTKNCDKDVTDEAIEIANKFRGCQR